MIPLVLITGFLGSGKTTLLRRIAEQNRQRKQVFLVNELSSVDVDGRQLASDCENVVSLPGGSIFCKCLVTSFIGQLREIAAKYDLPDSPLDMLIVEASGITDPTVAGRMLAETKLNAVYRLAKIVCVIDPGSFLKLLHTLPNILAQVESADLAILNKTDLYEEAILCDVERTLRGLKPSLRTVRAQYCGVSIDWIGDHGLSVQGGDYAACRDPNFASAELLTTRPVDFSRLMIALKDLGDDLYRIKGYVHTAAGTCFVDGTAGTLATHAMTSQEVRTELVLIFRPAAADRVQALLRSFSGSRSLNVKSDAS